VPSLQDCPEAPRLQSQPPPGSNVHDAVMQLQLEPALGQLESAQHTAEGTTVSLHAKSLPGVDGSGALQLQAAAPRDEHFVA
jgi:hypothetical protein